jgi:PPOX class probable F420-dependent enzyme
MTEALSAAHRVRLGAARTATLATIRPDGRPRLVPICFVLHGETVWTPLDDKPKAVSDPRDLARVRDIEREPRVELLVHTWSEDWSELAWLRIDGRAALTEPDPAAVVDLRSKYHQYEGHDLEHRPMLAIAIDDVTSWVASSTDADATRRPVE